VNYDKIQILKAQSVFEKTKNPSPQGGGFLAEGIKGGLRI